MTSKVFFLCSDCIAPFSDNFLAHILSGNQRGEDCEVKGLLFVQ